MSSVCLSSRIRLARNISGYEFPNKLEGKAKEKVLEEILAALNKDEFKIIKKDDLSENILGSLQEKNLVSRDFMLASNNGLALNESENASIMVNEEDHIRLQVIKSGLSLRECYNVAQKIDEEISNSLPYAYSEDYGYLTACPSNLGTGMRASVMMFLPALTTTGNIPNLIESVNKIGFTVRGSKGEGSKMDCYLYQISNMYTLGLTEEEILTKVENVIKKIESLELEQRKNLLESNFDDITDSLNRTYGELLHCYRVETGEAQQMLAKVKYGIDMGLIKAPNFDFYKLYTDIEKNNLILIAGNSLNESARDKFRAKYIQNVLNKREV